MRVGEVIGTVTLSRAHPALAKGALRLAVPLSQANLMRQSDARAEAIVVYDALGAGQGCLIAISEGREAAQPFDPEMVPVDAYNAAILDNVTVEES